MKKITKSVKALIFQPRYRSRVEKGEKGYKTYNRKKKHKNKEE